MSLSLWWDQLPETERSLVRPALASEIQVDVAIVGAGYTGLWTAYWLLRQAPDLRVAVLEAETSGFGASGRNGGWASALFPLSLDRIAKDSGAAAARDFHQSLIQNLRTIENVVQKEKIDCDFHLGGSYSLARTPVQVGRAQAEIDSWRSWGYGAADYDWLEADAARERLHATSVLGATWTPHCARVQPAKLVRGLAHAVERRGGIIYEKSRVLEVRERELVTAGSKVRADHIIDATEAWGLNAGKRGRAPVYSLMVATEPIADWDEIGLANYETFADYRHLIIYGQRTADNRIAFGGRGAPYHFGSAIDPRFDNHPGIHRLIREVLIELLPQLRDVGFSHAWGGPLGIPRDWYPSVGYDRKSGRGWAGGYVGDGVAATCLAGQTLADLVLLQSTERTALPWVNHRSPDWEVEPFRWLGVNAGLRVMTLADTEERLTGRPSKFAAGFGRFIGK